MASIGPLAGVGPLRRRALCAADRGGGAIGTVELGGFRIERGADGFLTEKTAAVDLAKRLGVGDRLIRTSPARDGAYVVFRGALHPLPTGFSLVAPIDLDGEIAATICDDGALSHAEFQRVM